MDTLNQEGLKELLETTGEYCISIYLPAHQTGREQQQDPVRFKNLTNQALERLIEYGMRRPDAQELTQPLVALLDDKNFWQHQGNGLAVFLAPGLFQTYRLPVTFNELLVITRSFHIKPLLPLLVQNRQFYILAISLNQIRLFLCTKDTVEQLELSGVPTSLAEALFMDNPEKHLNYHTGGSTPNTSGNRPVEFHGQGGQSDEQRKNDILRYFQYVNEKLDGLLESRNIPMVLAGVGYLHSIYRETSSYPQILKDGLEGNPDELRPEELLQRAWGVVAPVYEKPHMEVGRKFKRLLGQQSDLVSDNLETIVRAAQFGRVEALFIPIGIQQWGHFKPKDNQIEFESHPDRENEDLFNLAARQTILNSGQVFALAEEDIPGKGDLAAIFRYAN